MKFWQFPIQKQVNKQKQGLHLPKPFRIRVQGEAEAMQSQLAAAGLVLPGAEGCSGVCHCGRAEGLPLIALDCCFQ